MAADSEKKEGGKSQPACLERKRSVDFATDYIRILHFESKWGERKNKKAIAHW